MKLITWYGSCINEFIKVLCIVNVHQAHIPEFSNLIIAYWSRKKITFASFGGGADASVLFLAAGAQLPDGGAVEQRDRGVGHGGHGRQLGHQVSPPSPKLHGGTLMT